jgi:hypothetical protein
VPLLQIVPSKTDEERLLVVSPELADVLSTVIRRIREPDGAVPLVPIYDRYECLWRSPSPVLFQRRFPSEIRAVSDSSLRTMLNAALVHTGLKDPADGQPLHYTPHDFRRIFITDAVMSGLPPHIAQIIAGHRDIKVTLGYKAVYPDEAIQAHLAFLARRRALRQCREASMSITRLGATPLRWLKGTHAETVRATRCDRNCLLLNSFGVRMKKSGNPESVGRRSEKLGASRDSDLAPTRRCATSSLRRLAERARIFAARVADLNVDDAVVDELAGEVLARRGAFYPINIDGNARRAPRPCCGPDVRALVR